jgi:hypothetical protein
MTEVTTPIAICGIIMPISHVDEDHTAAHWESVLGFVKEAVTQAGLIPQPVWEKGDYDVIQAKILKNLFENEIVVCDVSTNNPNVMLELGMRLTTKKPTIIVAEEGTKLPFDTSVIHTDFYDPRLSYGPIRDFVKALAGKIEKKLEAARNGTHVPYLQHFEFETVQPNAISIPVDVAIADRLEELNLRLVKIDSRLASVGGMGGTSNSRIVQALIARKAESNAQAIASAKHDNILEHLQWAIDDVVGGSVGARVQHKKFGEGTVVSSVGNRLEVDFDRVGTKAVMSAFVTPLAQIPQEGASDDDL